MLRVLVQMSSEVAVQLMEDRLAFNLSVMLSEQAQERRAGFPKHTHCPVGRTANKLLEK